MASIVAAQANQNAAVQDPMRLHYETASKYLTAGDQQHADLEYRAFLAEALHRVANAEAQVGRFDAAFPLFERAFAFQPQDNRLRLDFASAALDADQLTRAKELAGDAARLDSRNARALLLFGRILYNLEDYKGAEPQLEAAVALNSDFETGYLLGKTYLLLHEEKKARTLFDEMAAGLGDTALLHIYFGRAYSLMDYPDLAVEEFHKAMARDSRARDAHYYLALAYLRHDETVGYAKAIPEFHAELKINPNDARSHYMLGYIAMRQRNFTDAEPELAKAAELQPQNLNTLVSLAEVYMGENRTADAEAALRKAIASAGNSDEQHQASRAHYLLGRLLMKAGRTDEAKQQMRLSSEDGAEAMNPAPVGEARSISSGSLVERDTRDRSGPSVPPSLPREQQNVERFKDQLAPLIAQAYNNLGALAANRRDFATAVQFFEAAGVWNPKLAGLDRNLGMAASYAGECSKAAPLLEHYLAEHPDDAAVRSARDQCVK